MNCHLLHETQNLLWCCEKTQRCDSSSRLKISCSLVSLWTAQVLNTAERNALHFAGLYSNSALCSCLLLFFLSVVLLSCDCISQVLSPVLTTNTNRLSDCTSVTRTASLLNQLREKRCVKEKAKATKCDNSSHTFSLNFLRIILPSVRNSESCTAVENQSQNKCSSLVLRLIL